MRRALLSRLIVVGESYTVQRMVEISLKGLSLDVSGVKDFDELSSEEPVEVLICPSKGPWGDESALSSQLSAKGISAPVIMLTPQDRVPEAFLGGPVVSALKKPFHTQSLVRAVCQLLNKDTPDEEIFAPKTAVPLKQGGRSTVSEPVVPASILGSVLNAPKDEAQDDAEDGVKAAPEGLIPPPEFLPSSPPPQQHNFQTIVGVPIPSNLPSEEQAEAALFQAEVAQARAQLSVENELPSTPEFATSFGFNAEGQEGSNMPLPTLRGGSYKEWAEQQASGEGNAFEASTSFGFSPDGDEALIGAPPLVYEEPPLAFSPESNVEILNHDVSSSSSAEPARSGEEEFDDLDDSFSALDRADIDLSPEWEDESFAPDHEEAKQSEEVDVEAFVQSSSPVLNSAVREVLKVVITSLKEAGIDQATSDEAIELFSEVAWEVIPELAEEIVRREIELALNEEEGC